MVGRNFNKVVNKIMWFGKVIGAALGGLVGSVPGAVVGGVVGHFFDRGLGRFQAEALTPQQKSEAEALFFESLFSLLGFVAKSDGRVSEEEVAQTELLMGQMNLSADMRTKAIGFFKTGSGTEFDVDALVARFSELAQRLPKLKQALLTSLINIALADGHLDPAEEQCLISLAEKLGFSSFAFKQLLAMLKAQVEFQRQRGSGQQGPGAQPSANELELAYKALGLEQSVSDQTLKRTYRKLMSENHPDKLMGQGVPQDLVDQATERSQRIQAAYDLIKKHRKPA
jgi:DnaJ like chaperone protein